MEDADYGGVPAGEDADDAAELTAVGESGIALARQELDEHLVALHGGVDFVGRDEDVFADGHAALPGVGPDEAEAVAVQVEASGDEVVASDDGAGHRPVVAVELDESSGGGEAGEVLEQQAAFAASGQRELADELLVAGALAGRAFDAAEEFAVGH